MNDDRCLFFQLQAQWIPETDHRNAIAGATVWVNLLPVPLFLPAFNIQSFIGKNSMSYSSLVTLSTSSMEVMPFSTLLKPSC